MNPQNPPPQPPMALAILEAAHLLCQQWVVPVCPLCGERHRHGGGKIGQDPRSFLGSRASHCKLKVRVQEDHGYILTEATTDQARALRSIWSGERYPWQVLGRDGGVLSRHRRRADADRARSTRRYPEEPIALVNRRLELLAGLTLTNRLPRKDKNEDGCKN